MRSSLSSGLLIAPVLEGWVYQQVYGPREHERRAVDDGVVLLHLFWRRRDQEHAPNGNRGIEIPHQISLLHDNDLIAVSK